LFFYFFVLVFVFVFLLLVFFTPHFRKTKQISNFGHKKTIKSASNLSSLDALLMVYSLNFKQDFFFSMPLIVKIAQLIA
ncbi:hypothetical protein, partial [Colwellia sp. MB02u-12]